MAGLALLLLACSNPPSPSAPPAVASATPQPVAPPATSAAEPAPWDNGLPPASGKVAPSTLKDSGPPACVPYTVDMQGHRKYNLNCPQ